MLNTVNALNETGGLSNIDDIMLGLGLLIIFSAFVITGILLKQSLTGFVIGVFVVIIVELVIFTQSVTPSPPDIRYNSDTTIYEETSGNSGGDVCEFYKRHEIIGKIEFIKENKKEK